MLPIVINYEKYLLYGDLFHTFRTLLKAFTMNPYLGELLTLITCIGTLLAAYKAYGISGLYAYSLLGLIIANIQVFKVVDLGLGNAFALGTTVMSTLFIASDFITEKYGPTPARRLVNLSFAAYFVFMCLMMITIKQTLPDDATPYNIASQQSLEHLFLPTPGFFAASLIAFMISQNVDIGIYAFLKSRVSYVFARASISSLIATFTDNLIFSVLAWIIFHPTPLAFEVVLYTYVFNGFLLRAFLALINAPVVKILALVEPRNAV